MDLIFFNGLITRGVCLLTDLKKAVSYKKARSYLVTVRAGPFKSTVFM